VPPQPPQKFIEYLDHGEPVLTISRDGHLTLHRSPAEVARVLEIIANGQARTNTTQL
jgi:hypothetical protein